MFRGRLGIGEKDLERLLPAPRRGRARGRALPLRGLRAHPLVGEDVHRYGRGVIVCELCRAMRREPPERTDRVRHAEGGQTVRVKARLAA
jgi:hypothetical protein